MALFRLATETLESSLPFPELLPAEGNPSLHFEQSLTGRPDRPVNRLIRSVEIDEGRVWVATSKIKDDFLFSFPRYSDFIFSPETGCITCYPRPETDVDTVRHLLLD